MPASGASLAAAASSTAASASRSGVEASRSSAGLEGSVASGLEGATLAGMQAERKAAGALLGLCGALALWGCGAKDEPDSMADGSGEARGMGGGSGTVSLHEGALNGSWQELGVPGAGNRPALATTPTGYYALSRRSVGDSRAPSAWESHLYRSTDGICWQRVEVSDANDNLWLRGVAYGGGNYVLAGMRFGEGDGVVFHSRDGEHWDELPVTTGAPSGLSGVVFAGSRFFALSTFRTLLSSTDGVAWTSIDLATTVMPLDVTFGKGQYLLVGSGDLQRSSDGLQWSPIQLDCAIPGACIMAPDGNVSQSVHYRAVFAAGAFFIDEASSTDGEAWRSLPGQYPQAGVDGHVLGSTATEELASWKPGEAPRPLAAVRYLETLSEDDAPSRMLWNGAVDPNEFDVANFPNESSPPEQVEFPVPGGNDCTVGSCFLVGDRLYLVSAVRGTQ